MEQLVDFTGIIFWSYSEDSDLTGDMADFKIRVKLIAYYHLV